MYIHVYVRVCMCVSVCVYVCVRACVHAYVRACGCFFCEPECVDVRASLECIHVCDHNDNIRGCTKNDTHTSIVVVPICQILVILLYFQKCHVLVVIYRHFDIVIGVCPPQIRRTKGVRLTGLCCGLPSLTEPCTP